MKIDLELSKTALRLVLQALCVCAMAVTAPSQQLSDAIDRVRPSILQIRLECVEADKQAKKYGTAFLVSKEGVAVTAAHVVDCGSGTALLRQRVKVGLPLVHSVTDQTKKSGNFKFIDAQVIEVDKVYDVAVVKLSRNPFREKIESGFTLNGKPLALAPPGVAMLSIRGAPREGESVAVSGFPFAGPTLCTNAGIIASVGDTQYFDTENDTGNEAIHVSIAFDFYLADMTINHGNSGGPLYDASGEVIGIASAFKVAEVEKLAQGAPDQTPQGEGATGYNAHLAVFVPIVYAKLLLDKHAIGLPSQ